MPESAKRIKSTIEEKARVDNAIRALRESQFDGTASKAAAKQLKALEILLANREQRVWDLAQQKLIDGPIDDSNVPDAPD